MKLFDSHCHLNDQRFQGDIDKIIAHMHLNGVERCLCPGSNVTDSKVAIKLAGQYSEIFASVGIHPHDAENSDDDSFAQIEALLSSPKVVALGEMGLDYYYDADYKEKQIYVLEKQFEIAGRCKMPVILHVRDAHQDMLDILKSWQNYLFGGIIHCFSSSAEVAKEYVKLGFYVSFAGPLTYKNARKLVEAAKLVPDDRLLIETDSPYLSPEPVRGTRNEPANVRFICQKLAEYRNQPVEQVAELTYANACKVYGL
ncbi:MAG: TatD family hydrolase [Christensenellales bacterium]|jgi:TatD DNase family protein